MRHTSRHLTDTSRLGHPVPIPSIRYLCWGHRLISSDQEEIRHHQLTVARSQRPALVQRNYRVDCIAAWSSPVYSAILDTTPPMRVPNLLGQAAPASFNITRVISAVRDTGLTNGWQTGRKLPPGNARKGRAWFTN